MGTVDESVPHSQGTRGMLGPESCSVRCCSMTCGDEWEMDILPATTPAPQAPPAWHKRGMMYTGQH
jgi:hypothetical protein